MIYPASVIAVITTATVAANHELCLLIAAIRGWSS